jgi:uncharacterized protein
MIEEKLYSITSDGISLRVKARPGASKDAVIGVRGTELMVAVRAVAERGRANEEIVKVLARHFGVPRESVSIRLGGASSHKVVRLPPEAEAGVRNLEAVT